MPNQLRHLNLSLTSPANAATAKNAAPDPQACLTPTKTPHPESPDLGDLLTELPESVMRAAGRSLLLGASALKVMELYSEVAILHLVRFVMTQNDSELSAAIDRFTICRNLSVSSVAPPMASHLGTTSWLAWRLRSADDVRLAGTRSRLAAASIRNSEVSSSAIARAAHGGIPTAASGSPQAPPACVS